MLRHINKHFALIIASIFVFLAFSAVAQLTRTDTDSSQQESVGFYDISGKKRYLSEFRGKVVLLNFWASWCAPCIKEMPDLDKLQAELGEENFKVIALSEDGKFPAVEEFYRKHNIKNLEIFHDRGSEVFFGLGLKGLPFSIVFDKQGKESTRISGFIDWTSGTRYIIEGLLKK